MSWLLISDLQVLKGGVLTCHANSLVAAGHDHQLRHAGGGADSRVHQGLHQLALQARPRDRHRFARRRRIADDPVRHGRRQLQRLLDGHADRRPDGRRLLRQPWSRCPERRLVINLSASRSSPSAWWRSASCAWARSTSPSKLRPGDRQRPVGLRAGPDRNIPGIKEEIKTRFRLRARLRRGQALPGSQRLGRQYVQGDGQAGADRHRRRRRHDDDFLDHPAARQSRACCTCSLTDAPVLLGFICGGAVIYWFCGRLDAGRHHRRLPGRRVHQEEHGPDKEEADIEDSKTVVRICTEYAQSGMWNIFIALMSITLAFAFFDPNFFVAYLISIAVFGLFQAIYMANAGGAWDNAKKIRRGRLEGEGHAAPRRHGRSATPSAIRSRTPPRWP